MADYSVPNVNAATGSNTTLNIFKTQLEPYKRVTWLHTLKQKILEYNSDGQYTIYNSTFKGRVNFEQTNGALHIHNVRKEDEGTYYMRVFSDGEVESKINLKVFDPVSKPFIAINTTEELAGSCHLKLSCEVEDQPVDYTWYGESGPFLEKNLGGVLEISITPQNKSAFYTCQVSNPVSSKNETVYFISPCFLVRSSGARWIAAWLVVMAPIIHAILLT